jgi:hypothetical protein
MKDVKIIEAPFEKIKALKDPKFEEWILEMYYGYCSEHNKVTELQELEDTVTELQAEIERLKNK